MTYHIYYNNRLEIYEVRNSQNSKTMSSHTNLAGAKLKLEYLVFKDKEINHIKTVEAYFENRDRQK